MKMVNQKNNHPGRRGVTLVELLVVLSIMTFLTAMLIPRIRMINKDRGIRESSRVLASAFAKVSSRAIDEQVAGFLLERNPNFVDANGVTFGTTTMYTLRAIPPYGGDEPYDPGSTNGAVVSNTAGIFMTVDIPLPLEYTPTNPLVQINDHIRLNYSSVRYRIANVQQVPSASGPRLELTLLLGEPTVGVQVLPGLENSPTGTSVPFLIYRKPRKLESSRIDLPAGYVIDLRFSGPVDRRPVATNTGTLFNEVTPAGDSIELMFDEHGAVERFYYTDPNATPSTRVSRVPRDALYFFVVDLDANESVLPINGPGNMWVTLERTTGAANVSYNAPPPNGLPLNEQVEFARTLARNRLSVAQ